MLYIIFNFIVLFFRQGASGALEGASNQMLEVEFGTKIDEEVIKIIMDKGEVQETEVRKIHNIITRCRPVL